jgi:hypothetical protein
MDNDGLPLDEVGAGRKTSTIDFASTLISRVLLAENLSRAAAAQLISISIAVPAEP